MSLLLIDYAGGGGGGGKVGILVEGPKREGLVVFFTISLQCILISRGRPVPFPVLLS